MRNAKIYIAQQTDVNDVNGTAVKDAEGASFRSNKVTATGLKENATYYYSYQKDGKWTEPVAYTTKDSSVLWQQVCLPRFSERQQKSADIMCQILRI